MFIACVRSSDDSIADVAAGFDAVPSTPPGGAVTFEEITSTEYDDVTQAGLYLPGTTDPRWEFIAGAVQEITDARPELTFVPDTVDAEVGDVVVIAVTADTGMTGTLNLGVTTLDFVLGTAALTVDTVVPRQFILDAGTNYKVAAPLNVTIKPQANHI